MRETLCWPCVAGLNGSRIAGYLRADLAIRASTATSSTAHAQHGTGIFVGLERDVCVVCTDGTLARGRIVVVPPDVPHEVASPGVTLGMLHDPEATPALTGFAR